MLSSSRKNIKKTSLPSLIPWQKQSLKKIEDVHGVKGSLIFKEKRWPTLSKILLFPSITFFNGFSYMSSGKDQQIIDDTQLEHLILTKGTRFEGRLSFEGIARVNGYFKGEIITPGMLVIESAGRVEAKISAQDVIIKGWVKGEIQAHGQVRLVKGSEFYGSLSSPKLHIESGLYLKCFSQKTIYFLFRLTPLL